MSDRYEVSMTVYVDAVSKEDAEAQVFDALLTPPFEVASLAVEPMQP